MILDKLESMNKKLSKLDNIETEVKRISQSVTAHDSRQTILENRVHEWRRTITDIETSRNSYADICRNIEIKQRKFENST